MVRGKHYEICIVCYHVNVCIITNRIRSWIKELQNVLG